jgi:hypothetical protein
LESSVTGRAYKRTTLAKRTLDLAASLLEAPEQVLVDTARELSMGETQVDRLAANIFRAAVDLDAPSDE